MLGMVSQHSPIKKLLKVNKIRKQKIKDPQTKISHLA